MAERPAAGDRAGYPRFSGSEVSWIGSRGYVVLPIAFGLLWAFHVLTFWQAFFLWIAVGFAWHRIKAWRAARRVRRTKTGVAVIDGELVSRRFVAD